MQVKVSKKQKDTDYDKLKKKNQDKKKAINIKHKRNQKNLDKGR